MNSLIVWGVGFKSYLKTGYANHSASIITIITYYIGVVILEDFDKLLSILHTI